MRRGSEPTFTTRVKVLLAVFSSPESGPAAIWSVLAPAPPISNIKVSVWRLPSGPRLMLRDASIFDWLELAWLELTSRTVRLIFAPAYPRWWKVFLAARREG